jgi:hypothetical protein
LNQISFPWWIHPTKCFLFLNPDLFPKAPEMNSWAENIIGEELISDL